MAVAVAGPLVWCWQFPAKVPILFQQSLETAAVAGLLRGGNPQWSNGEGHQPVQRGPKVSTSPSQWAVGWGASGTSLPNYQSRVFGETEFFRVFQGDYKDRATFDAVTQDIACRSERNDHVVVIGRPSTGLA